MMEDSTLESSKLREHMLNPTKDSPFLTMLEERDSGGFMFRGGEFPPSAWDHDPVIAAMKNALDSGERVEFLSGPLLCIGSMDTKDNFRPSKLLTEIVLPNLEADCLSFCSRKFKTKPKIRRSGKSQGYIDHKNEMHYRAGDEMMIAHLHRNNERHFCQVRKVEDKYNHIGRTRARFSEELRRATEDPENSRYEKLSEHHFIDEEKRQSLKNRFIVQRNSTVNELKTSYYSDAEDSVKDRFFYYSDVDDSLKDRFLEWVLRRFSRADPSGQESTEARRALRTDGN